jgi:hypothetical protein
MKRGVRRKPYKFVCQSKRTDLRIHIGQIIKVREVKYEVVPELREKGLQMGCWGCAFNQATKREDFEIPLCKCTLQNDRYPVTVYIYRLMNFHLHDIKTRMNNEDFQIDLCDNTLHDLRLK